MTLETKEGLFALMEQIAAEREAARPIVEELVASGESLEDIEIPEGWRTAGMVMELADAAYAKNESRPRQSLALAQLSFTLCRSIPEDIYPSIVDAYLKGRTWKEIGFAQRYLCAYDPAAEAFERAEHALSFGALTYAAATAIFARATIHYLARDYDQSTPLIAKARQVFYSVGDQRRMSMCEILEGIVSVSRGDLETGRAKLETALQTLLRLDDLHSIGSVYNNLGVIYRRLGRMNDSLSALHRAREIFVQLEMPSEINRAEWNIASVMIERGEVLEALPILRRLRKDYLEREMPEDAAEIGLWIVDALVAMERPDEARALTEQVLKEFTDAKLSLGVTTALAYLRDLLQTTRTARAAIRHVRSYVEKLRSEPQLLFVPPDKRE